MYVGVYLCLSGIAFLAGAAILSRARRPLWRYALLAVVPVAACFIAFEVLSSAVGITPPGARIDWSYPGDYTSHGLGAWLIALLPLAGAAAPLGIALLLRRHKPEPR